MGGVSILTSNQFTVCIFGHLSVYLANESDVNRGGIMLLLLLLLMKHI